MLENNEKNTLNENVRNDSLSGGSNNNDQDSPVLDIQIDSNDKPDNNFLKSDVESPDPVTLEDLE